jgi:hypothetical protein
MNANHDQFIKLLFASFAGGVVTGALIYNILTSYWNKQYNKRVRRE